MVSILKINNLYLSWKSILFFLLQFFLLIVFILSFLNFKISFLLFIVYQMIVLFYFLLHRFFSFFIFNFLFFLYVDGACLVKLKIIDIFVRYSTFFDNFAFLYSYKLSLIYIWSINFWCILLQKNRNFYFTQIRQSNLDKLTFAITILISFFFGVFFCLWTYKEYGGFLSFLSTPYDPVYEGAAEYSIKHVLAGYSGMFLVVSNFGSYLLFKTFKSKICKFFNSFIFIISFILLFTFLYQGKRDYFLILLSCYSLIFLLKSVNYKEVFLKGLIILFIILLIAGIIVYKRGDAQLIDFSLKKIITIPFGIETACTYSTFIDSVFKKEYYNLDYQYFVPLLNSLLFIIPSPIYSFLGIKKSNSGIFFNKFNQIEVDILAGEFLLKKPYESFGVIAIIIFGILVGIFLRKLEKNILFSLKAIDKFNIVIIIVLLIPLIRKGIAYFLKRFFVMIILVNIIYIVIKNILSVYRKSSSDL